MLLNFQEADGYILHRILTTCTQVATATSLPAGLKWYNVNLCKTGKSLKCVRLYHHHWGVATSRQISKLPLDTKSCMELEHSICHTDPQSSLQETGYCTSKIFSRYLFCKTIVLKNGLNLKLMSNGKRTADWVELKEWAGCRSWTACSAGVG